jgi:hypothetical protein
MFINPLFWLHHAMAQWSLKITMIPGVPYETNYPDPRRRPYIAIWARRK